MKNKAEGSSVTKNGLDCGKISLSVLFDGDMGYDCFLLICFWTS